MRTCSVDGCDKKHRVKGFCNTHYQHWLRWGDPLFIVKKPSQRICSINGCEKVHAAKGYCKNHYEKLRIYGDPNFQRKFNEGCKIIGCLNKHACKGYCDIHYHRIKKRGTIHIPTQYEKFTGKIKINEQTGCWDWLGRPMSNGYGVISDNGKQQLTHRYSFTKHTGEIPDGMVVMHLCDRPICCNPDHLKLGTQAENLLDMKEKGRHRAGVGERHRNAILSESQARHIKEMLKLGRKGAEIAKELNVSRHVIYAIKQNKSWTHVQLEEK